MFHVSGGIGRISKIRVLTFGYPESDEKWVEGKLNKAFLHFLAIFDDFSKLRSTFSSVFHFEKSSNMAKIWQKIKNCLINPFLHSTAGTRNPGFE